MAQLLIFWIYTPIRSGAKVEAVEVITGYGQEPNVYESMYFREFLEVKDKYSTFLGTNQPIINIKTDVKGEKLLIIKDSYAHSFAPFLTQHYSEITLVDMRYINIQDLHNLLILRVMTKYYFAITHQPLQLTKISRK